MLKFCFSKNLTTKSTVMSKLHKLNFTKFVSQKFLKCKITSWNMSSILMKFTLSKLDMFIADNKTSAKFCSGTHHYAMIEMFPFVIYQLEVLLISLCYVLISVHFF